MATVAKAKSVYARTAQADQEAEERREKAQAEQEAQRKREREKELGLLLMMLDDLAQSNDHQRRGYLLQDLLARLFTLNEISVRKSFTRNEGGEQIDGAFELDGWYYLVECRWREILSDIRQLDGLNGQVGRSGRQTMGLYFSINGWSTNVVPLLKQNPVKTIILMEGYDLRMVLTGEVDFTDLIKAKLAQLNIDCEPFYSVRQYLDMKQ